MTDIARDFNLAMLTSERPTRQLTPNVDFLLFSAMVVMLLDRHVLREAMFAAEDLPKNTGGILIFYYRRKQR